VNEDMIAARETQKGGEETECSFPQISGSVVRTLVVGAILGSGIRTVTFGMDRDGLVQRWACKGLD
jgi:hypothetical protein